MPLNPLFGGGGKVGGPPTDEFGNVIGGGGGGMPKYEDPGTADIPLADGGGGAPSPSSGVTNPNPNNDARTMNQVGGESSGRYMRLNDNGQLEVIGFTTEQVKSFLQIYGADLKAQKPELYAALIEQYG